MSYRMQNLTISTPRAFEEFEHRDCLLSTNKSSSSSAMTQDNRLFKMSIILQTCLEDEKVSITNSGLASSGQTLHSESRGKLRTHNRRFSLQRTLFSPTNQANSLNKRYSFHFQGTRMSQTPSDFSQTPIRFLLSLQIQLCDVFSSFDCLYCAGASLGSRQIFALHFVSSYLT